MWMFVRMLTKSIFQLQTSGSEASIADAMKKEKKNLKKKLSNMFKRGSKSNG